MGVVFLEAIGDPSEQFDCRNCYAYLSNKLQIRSRAFQSGNGAAFLFDKVVNITSGKSEERNMLTGRHYVRDVHCKKCNEKLGWMYEFACLQTQQYKEGKVILEVAQLRSSGKNLSPRPIET